MLRRTVRVWWMIYLHSVYVSPDPCLGHLLQNAHRVGGGQVSLLEFVSDNPASLSLWL